MRAMQKTESTPETIARTVAAALTHAGWGYAPLMAEHGQPTFLLDVPQPDGTTATFIIDVHRSLAV